jgi:hypothetical protein
MKTDLYTKAVLTVIAIALCTLAIQNMNFIQTAKADPQRVLSDEINVNIEHIGGSSVYGSLPVNLKEISGSSFYGSLPINLKEVNGSSVGSSGIPMNLEKVNGSSINMTGIPVNIQAVNGTSVWDAVPVKTK